MNWFGVVLSLILGLGIVSWQDVHASKPLAIKGNNGTKPGNKTFVRGTPLAERYLYSQFACRGKIDGLRLPVAGSCVDYYECQQGRALQRQCKEGLHFSMYGLTCLDARLSKCVPEQTQDFGRCEGPCCYRDDGLYPVRDSCSDFLICLNKLTMRRNCGKHLRFSPDKQICDIPERAQCTAMIDRDIIQKDIENPLIYNVSHRVCLNKPDGYNVPIIASCNKFYLCIHGTGFLKSCGKLQFNMENGYCDTITRKNCVGDEANDLILDEDEYEPIDAKPMPIPQPRPQLRPLPMVDENEYEIEAGQTPQRKPQKGQQPQSGKRPRPPVVYAEENEYEPEPAYPPQKKPQVGEIPRPPVVYAEENEYEVESAYPPQKKPVVPKKPVLEKKQPPKERPQDGKRPNPTVVVEELDEQHNKEETLQYWPQPGNKPAQKPYIEDNAEEEEHSSFGRPIMKPQVPMPPITGPLPSPPNVEDEEEGQNVDIENSNICADKPVGALLPIPGDCNKYIRCRWDWFERRAVEIMSCPKYMHFNAKSKYCDWPESAGCMPNTRKSDGISKKIKKFSSL